MRRALLVGLVVSLTAVAAATARAASAPATGVWDPAEIHAVETRGLMTATDDDFRPNDSLTWGELAGALQAWGHPIAAPANADKAVTVRELDARIVAALGLQPQSRTIRLAARDAGLLPISSLGTETVARLAGLRINHPQDAESLELEPWQPITRAEAAYSFAHALALTDWKRQQILDETSSFAFPQLTDWQRTVLTRALRFVGDPYVFSGTSEKLRQKLWNGRDVPGGFDCSGFVWRVYKLEAFDGAPTLADMLKGRTTYAMSGEVAAAERIPVTALEPADVVFFGSKGPASRPADVGHMGIYLGNGWIVHSSTYGVTLTPMTGWYANTFAWARRPIAEAGLDGTPAAPAV